MRGKVAIIGLCALAIAGIAFESLAGIAAGSPAALPGLIARQGGLAAALIMLVSPWIVLFLAVRGILRSRTHQRELRARIRDQRAADTLAKLDPLTGLLNRRGLIEDVRIIAADNANHRKALSLMLLDLDHFKTVNDIHGHLTGDELIKRVAQRIQEICPEEALIARMGGDEFAIAMDFEPDFEVVVESVATEIVAALAQPFVIDEVPMHIGVSIGISSTDRPDSTITGLLREADVAMYQAKQNGRGAIRWFDQSMEQAIKERSAIEAELRIALQNGQIVPYYEPQIDLNTGEIAGFEVLARWLHPERGTIMPNDFIGIAEESGQIAELSYSVIRQALADAVHWPVDIVLAVNISPVQLRDPAFAQRLLKLFVEVRYPPQRLEVEITELALLADIVTAKSVINSLKNQGVKLTLDDFGTGYSSLHHLRALPFDRIKIDRSFVISIHENPESMAIVNAVLGLGNSLGIEVTAEGIETQAIADKLRALGCPRGQGWLYSKPVPCAAAAAMIGSNGVGSAGGPGFDGLRRNGTGQGQ